MLLVAAIVAAHGWREEGLRATDELPRSGLPVGKWSVEFSNGVREVCAVSDGGECTVYEPRRAANGVAEVQGGSVVLRFQDDRVERWTPVGTRFVVEHWYPASRLPITSPVLGIAERGL
jgi:hypothetical protein